MADFILKCACAGECRSVAGPLPTCSAKGWLESACHPRAKLGKTPRAVLVPLHGIGRQDSFYKQYTYQRWCFCVSFYLELQKIQFSMKIVHKLFSSGPNLSFKNTSAQPWPNAGKRRIGNSLATGWHWLPAFAELGPSPHCYLGRDTHHNVSRSGVSRSKSRDTSPSTV